MRQDPSQHEGPAAGTTRITLAAPGVPNGIPAVTTSKSFGSETSPFFKAALHAFLKTKSKSSVATSDMAVLIKGEIDVNYSHRYGHRSYYTEDSFKLYLQLS